MAKKEAPKESKAKETKQKQKKEVPKKDVTQKGKTEKIDEKQEKKRDKKPEKPETKGEGKGQLTKANEKSQPAKSRSEIKHIVRISDTDLDGKRSIQYALIGIRGISRRIAKTISINSGLDPTAILGYTDDVDIAKLQSSVDAITSIVPYWMVNKQNDFITGEDRHAISTDVMLSVNDDINLMKKMRSYKGVRHERGLRVRGQCTRSTGRRGRTIGVTRATLTATKAKAKEGEKKEEKKEAGK